MWRAMYLVACLLYLTPVVLPGQAPSPPKSVPDPHKFALLIGIDTYQPENENVQVPAGVKREGRFESGLRFKNLKGPKYDVAAMRALLTSEKFNWPNDDAHIHLLMDEQATRQAMLDAMQRYLVDQPQANDTVVLYLSSHGSLRVNSNPKANGQVFLVDGQPKVLENTIVPADAWKGSEDILNRDLRRIFVQAAEKHVRLTVIIDACHAANQGRDDGTTRVDRALGYDPRPLDLAPDQDATGALVAAGQDREQTPVLVFAAAQKDQSAIDIQTGTPHGLFTRALIEALEALPADVPATDVLERVKVDLENSGAANPQPGLDASPARKALTLFGAPADQTQTRTAVISVDEEGAVLDIGQFADVGVGSEFIADNAQHTVLRVTRQDDGSRSLAVVVSPAGATVQPKEFVSISKWLPAPRPTLNVWIGPAALPASEIRKALALVRTSGVALVSDPSAQAWTHRLRWNGSQWRLDAAPVAHALGTRAMPPVLLGPRLSPAALKRALPASASLWMDVPASSELASALGAAEGYHSLHLAPTEAEAVYELAGVPTATGVAYTWYEQGGLQRALQTPPGFGAGCAPDSPYPLRKDWVDVLDDAGSIATAEHKLADEGAELATLNGWLHLESSVTGASSFPYHLSLRTVADNRALADGDALHDQEHFRLELTGTPTSATPSRWVYVLRINCRGEGKLMWPLRGAGGHFPTKDGRLPVVPLPESSYHITPPLGTETYVLLTTATQLNDPSRLNFRVAPVTADRGDPPNPLEDLLNATSTGSRSDAAEVPTAWGVRPLTIHTLPATAVK